MLLLYTIPIYFFCNLFEYSVHNLSHNRRIKYLYKRRVRIQDTTIQGGGYKQDKYNLNTMIDNYITTIEEPLPNIYKKKYTKRRGGYKKGTRKK